MDPEIASNKSKETSMIDSRRRTLLRAAAAGAASTLAFPAITRAASAEYVFKYGNNLPMTHPLNVRAKEAADQVKEQSKGRMEIRLFPNNQLGGDTDMLAQVRSGGIEIFNPGTLVIATLAPISAITGVGFAFSGYDQVWGAVDGKLGDSIRAAFAKVGLYTFDKMWDNGFRQITTSTRPVA